MYTAARWETQVRTVVHPKLSIGLIQGIGALLTEGNVKSISTFLEEFSTRSLLPNLEARVRLLHHQVVTCIC
jgi:hypothetical protein